MAAASLRLVTSSANNFFSILQFLYQPSKQRRLGRCQRVLSRLRIGKQQQNLVVIAYPVVNDPYPAALAAALRRPSQLAYSTTASNKIATIGVRRELLLKLGVFVVRQQYQDLTSERWGLDEQHVQHYTLAAYRSSQRTYPSSQGLGAWRHQPDWHGRFTFPEKQRATSPAPPKSAEGEIIAAMRQMQTSGV